MKVKRFRGCQATWYFADGTSKTVGVNSSNVYPVLMAGHRVAAKRNTTLIGHSFVWRMK